MVDLYKVDVKHHSNQGDDDGTGKNCSVLREERDINTSDGLLRMGQQRAAEDY